MTLRSVGDLEVICPYPKLLRAQAKVKCLYRSGPGLNKHYSARGGPINISFVYITQGCYVNILGKFRDLRAVRWLFT